MLDNTILEMNTNTPPSTNRATPPEVLPVMEQFYTLQGEGYHQGKAAYFIRLAGCNVGCHWCDVKESWDADAHPRQALSEIIAAASKFPSRIAVITGGEPLIYQLDELCHQLHTAGFDTHIETSGAYSLSGQWDWICLSPKKFKAPLPDVIAAAHELKVVVFNKHDFEWAEQYAALVNVNCKLYLQPEWSKAQQMMPLITEYVKRYPKWRISLQTHKYLDIP
ncbi:MAG: 7-carboxy-7-deazaguanine synthase QueE [Chitinophagales bacterium]